ncbi:MAG TPA: SIMPL domain-containing protein, partial [Candidatus Baltobacteraceae bacterium]|nr:SIMPL domain-containing protein [Candidatus Baltobacteraceae bacterium]
TLALAALSAGCGARPQAPYQPQSFANVREDVTVRMPSGDVQGFVAALRHAAPDYPGENVNVSAWRGNPLESSSADASVYEAALDDARRKASTIAAHVGARVLAVASVTEYQGSASADPARMTLGVAHGVTVASGGPVTLAVVYAISSGGTVAVFGLADAAAHGAPRGVSINLSASGPSMEAARVRVADLEAYVRRVARDFKLQPQALTFSDLGFNRN